jgi:hypothetical protein
MAAATIELHKRGEAHQITIMGGKTGGNPYASEAELIARNIMNSPEKTQDIPITLENASLDTIENLVNFLNMHTDAQLNGVQFDILCSSYHITRLQLLFKLFDIPKGNIFSAEEVLRFAAKPSQSINEEIDSSLCDEEIDSTQWDIEKLTAIENQLNPNLSTNFYFNQKGAETRDVLDRRIAENALIYELLAFPEKWLSYVGKLNSDTRVLAILQQTEVLYPGMLRQKYGIDIMTAASNLTDIRTVLDNIKYTGSGVEWEKFKKNLQEETLWIETREDNPNLTIMERFNKLLELEL